MLDNIRVNGQQRSQVSLQIPLNNVNATLADFELELDKARLHEKVVDLHLTAIPKKTILYGSESAFVVNPFSARLDDQPARVAVDTRPDINTGLVHTNLYAQVSTEAKAFWPDHVLRVPTWLNEVKGESDYAMTLSLPLNAKKYADNAAIELQQRYPYLHVVSSLQGVSVEFPEPIKKPASDIANIDVKVLLLPENKIGIDFVLHDYAKGSVMTTIEQNILNINSGDILLRSSAEPSASNRDGIAIQGRVQKFDMDEWLDYINSQQGDGGKNIVLDAIRFIDVDVASLYYSNREFMGNRVTATQSPQSWLLNIKNEALKGEINVPKSDILNNGIVARFDSIDWNAIPPAYSRSAVLNPKDVPLLQLSIGRLKMNDYIFDNVNVTTSRVLHGINIDSFTVNNPSLNIAMQGEWINAPDGSSETRIAGKLTTENLGQGLNNMGYAKLIEGGFGNIDFSFNWPNSPVDVSFKNLAGEASGIFEEGDILTIDPGAGRILSLISLTQLPKRLLLDFKDVDSKGYYFKKMTGKFAFNSGVANAERFYMRSSLGKMYITGETNLIEQSYDQELRFIPDLSSSLPIIGTLLGGGNTGVGLLVLDGVARIFGKQLDDFGETKYKITGSWDEPSVEPVVRQTEIN